nr:MAG TPA: hypothetical protein [Herelleviridae sp.]
MQYFFIIPFFSIFLNNRHGDSHTNNAYFECGL